MLIKVFLSRMLIMDIILRIRFSQLINKVFSNSSRFWDRIVWCRYRMGRIRVSNNKISKL